MTKLITTNPFVRHAQASRKEEQDRVRNLLLHFDMERDDMKAEIVKMTAQFISDDIEYGMGAEDLPRIERELDELSDDVLSVIAHRLLGV